jgi:hypothetical protein
MLLFFLQFYVFVYSQEVEVIGYEKLKEKVEEHNYTAIYLWRTWCGYDIENIDRIDSLKKEFEQLGIEFICLSVMSDIEKQKEILNNISFNKKSYAIFSNYNSKPKIKPQAHIEIINAKLCPECNTAIFPALYLYDKHMHIVYKSIDESSYIIIKDIKAFFKKNKRS